MTVLCWTAATTTFFMLPMTVRVKYFCACSAILKKKEELHRILSLDLTERRANWRIENDAIDKNGDPVLFAYSCDMPRIARYNTALELQGRNGMLICFDYQRSVLERYCGSRIRFQTIGFDKFERRFFP